MKKILLLALLSTFYASSIVAQNTWLETFGNDDEEEINVVETDDAGNIYLAGRMNKDLTIADSVVKKTGSASPTVDNYFIVKLDKNGNFKWGSAIRAFSNGDVSDIAVDKNFNVYMSLESPSYYYKYDSTGKQLFEKRINAFNGRIRSLEIDDEGYTWLGCSFNDRPFKLDNLPTIDPDGRPLMFLAKLDENGNGVMVVPFASNTVTSQIAKIAVKDSFVYAIGNTQFNVVVGPDTLQNCDMLIAKFNTNGEYKWAKGITGTDPIGFENVNDIAISDNHQVVITGRYDDPIFVENITLPNQFEREQMFMVSYDKDGNLQWARNSTSYNVSGLEIRFTPENTLAFVANYAFRFTYGGVNVGNNISGKRAPVLMETDTLGNPLWAYSLGQTDWTYVRGLAIDNKGNWFVVGSYTADPTSTIDEKTVTANGRADLYLIKNFTLPEPNVQDETFCGGEPVKEITAIGAGIKWYSDSALTNLVYEGATINIMAGTTTSYYVIQKAGGAISQAVKVTATILPATQVTLQTTFPVLTANPQNGKSYKWYADGVEISGANLPNYTPTKSGNYHAVLIDSNDCNNYSDTVNYVFTSVNELENSTAIYPNPASNNVTIEGIPLEMIEEISLLSIDGKKLKVYEPTGRVLDLQGIENGLYLISVKTANSQFVEKLLIQK